MKHLLNIIFPFSVKAINNSKTSNHVRIEGTRIFIIPPEKYKLERDVQAFVHPSGVSNIIAAEVPFMKFEDYKTGINDKTFNAQGILLKKKKDIQINDKPGIIVKTEQINGALIKYTLSYGDDRSTALIHGSYFRNQAYLFKWRVLKSLFSVIDEPGLEFDQNSAFRLAALEMS